MVSLVLKFATFAMLSSAPIRLPKLFNEPFPSGGGSSGKVPDIGLGGNEQVQFAHCINQFISVLPHKWIYSCIIMIYLGTPLSFKCPPTGGSSTWRSTTFLNSPQLMQLWPDDLLALQRRVTKNLAGQEKKLGGHQNLKDNEATKMLQVPELHLVKTKS